MLRSTVRTGLALTVLGALGLATFAAPAGAVDTAWPSDGAATTSVLVEAPSTGTSSVTADTRLPAAQPLDLPGRITDPDGVLGNQTDEVEAAMDRLEADTPYQLYVVYVDTFDGQDAQTWATATANLSGLGRDDVLLAVATEDRRYDLSADNNIGLSDASLDKVQAAVEDQLSQEEWAQSAIVAADTLRTEATGSSSSGGSGWLIVLVVGLLAIAGFFVVRSILRKRRGTAARQGGTDEADELSQLPTDELNRRASSALVAIDDAIKT